MNSRKIPKKDFKKKRTNNKITKVDISNSTENNDIYKLAGEIVAKYNTNMNSIIETINSMNLSKMVTTPLSIAQELENLNIGKNLLPDYESSLFAAIKDIRNDFSIFNKFEDILPKYDFLSVSDVLGSARNATLAISHLTNKVDELAALAIPNMSEWFDSSIIQASALSNSLFSDFNIKSMSESISEIIGMQNLSALNIQSTLANAAEMSIFAEKSLASFPWESLGSRVDISNIAKNVIGDSFLGFSSAYSNLLTSFKLDPASFIDINPSITNLPHVEYYTGANLLEVISTDSETNEQEEHLISEIQTESEYSLNIYLPKVHKGLLNIWKGAVETYSSKNIDKIRHFAVSMRELFTHLLQKLAPDKEIKEWSSNPIYYYDKKPTRKARLFYICRNISNQPFNKLVEKDIDATIEFINLFQEGTHSIESNFTEPQMIALRSKAESTLRFLLEIEFNVNK